MSATTKKNTAPSLLTEDTIREVCEALLHHALRGHQGAVEHEGVVPPVGVEQVTYRRGPLEVEELGWSAGGAKVAQQIDVWVPAGLSSASTRSIRSGAGHATLGEVDKRSRQVSLGDGTTVITGTYSVEVFPYLPLIEERSAQAAHLALGNRHRQREVGKVYPVEGKPEHRTQRVELGMVVVGSARPLLDELRGSNTSAGHISSVEVIGARADKVGSGSFATATPSHDRNAVQLAVTLEWREA